MRQILALLEKISSSSKDNCLESQDDASLEEMFDDLMRSIRRKLASGHVTATPIKRKKDALYRLYSRDHTAITINDCRRHSSVGFEEVASVKDFLTVREAKKQRRSEGSLLDCVRNKLFSAVQRSEETVPEAVARKIAERKREIKHLTRSQTVELMRLKYNLNKKSG